MTITAKSCAEFLRKYNGWRRGGEGQMLEPKEIGLNLDFAIAALESDADIATLEQESRQMRARMERLEAELEAERALSFRNQVAELEAQRDALLAALEYYVDNSSEHDCGGGDVVVATCESRERAIKAIASVKGLP